MNYTKVCITKNEIAITAAASDNDICAKLLSSEHETFITTELWPLTLEEISIHQWFKYKASVVECLSKLHSLKIIHCDLSEQNIVVNPLTCEARLIDFGMSKYISDVNIDEFNEQNDFDAQSSEDLKRYDFDDIRLLFGSY